MIFEQKLEGDVGARQTEETQMQMLMGEICWACLRNNKKSVWLESIKAEISSERL
jgi:hypothetical protein